MDTMGNIIATPISKKVRAKIEKHMEEMTGSAYHDLFLNDGFEASQWLENDCPTELKEDLEKGYPIEFDADEWTVGNWYGYDLCEVL